MFFKKNKNDFELKTEEDSSYYEYEDDTDFFRFDNEEPINSSLKYKHHILIIEIKKVNTIFITKIIFTYIFIIYLF